MQYIELALLNQGRCDHLSACSSVNSFYSIMAELAAMDVSEGKSTNNNTGPSKERKRSFTGKRTSRNLLKDENRTLQGFQRIVFRKFNDSLGIGLKKFQQNKIPV